MSCYRLSRVAVAVTVMAGTSFLPAMPILTPQGAAMGFSLSNVISGAPGSTVLPDILGIVVNSSGQIVFNNSSNNTNYLIANVDNQVFSNPGTVLASNPNSGFPSALAAAGGFLWASGGALQKLDQNGALIATFSNIPVVAGLATNPVTGQLIGIANEKLISIDVSGATPVVTIIQSGLSADGLAVSPDGTKAYLGIHGNNIVDLVGPAHAISSFGNVPGIDGVGIVSSNNLLNGSIIANTTTGNIVLVDPQTLLQTIIASGTGYGDYVAPDPTNGTLLLSSSNSIMRLACGAGCGIGTIAPRNLTDMPEPATTGLVAVALAAMAILRFRYR